MSKELSQELAAIAKPVFLGGTTENCRIPDVYELDDGNLVAVMWSNATDANLFTMRSGEYIVLKECGGELWWRTTDGREFHAPFVASDWDVMSRGPLYYGAFRQQVASRATETVAA